MEEEARHADIRKEVLTKQQEENMKKAGLVRAEDGTLWRRTRDNKWVPN